MQNTYLADIIQAIANGSKDHLVDFTKVLNHDAYPGLVDKFMDQAVGRGHRLVFGHDASYLPEIFEKYGLPSVPLPLLFVGGVLCYAAAGMGAW